MTTNNIITFSLGNLSLEDAAKKYNEYDKKAAEALFVASVLVGYGCGLEIPAYTRKDGKEVEASKCKDAKKQKDFVDITGKSKGTISKRYNAIKFIIDNDVFSLFASGSILFSTEKIAYISAHKDELTASHDIKDLFAYSLDSLEDMIKRVDNNDKKSTPDDNSNDTDNDNASDNEQNNDNDTITTFELNGKKYTVARSILNDFLSKCNEVADDTELSK